MTITTSALMLSDRTLYNRMSSLPLSLLYLARKNPLPLPDTSSVLTTLTGTVQLPTQPFQLKEKGKVEMTVGASPLLSHPLRAIHTILPSWKSIEPSTLA
jgi:hypothetical protein